MCFQPGVDRKQWSVIKFYLIIFLHSISRYFNKFFSYQKHPASYGLVSDSRILHTDSHTAIVSSRRPRVHGEAYVDETEACIRQRTVWSSISTSGCYRPTRYLSSLSDHQWFRFWRSDEIAAAVSGSHICQLSSMRATGLHSLHSALRCLYAVTFLSGDCVFRYSRFLIPSHKQSWHSAA